MNMIDGEGPTYAFAHPGMFQKWKNPGGDWLDADGVKQGPKPFVVFELRNENDFKGWISVDVTAIAKRPINRGYLLSVKRAWGGSWGVKFQSRQAENKPRLVVTTDQGTFTLPSTLDTNVDPTTGYDLSLRSLVEVSPVDGPNTGAHGILRFDMTKAPGVVQSARLELYQVALYGWHDLLIYELDLPELLTDIGAQHPELVEAGGGVPVEEWPRDFTVESLRQWYDWGYLSGTAPSEVIDLPEYGRKALRVKFDNIVGGASATHAWKNFFQKDPAKRKAWQGDSPFTAMQDVYVRYWVRPGLTLKNCMRLQMKLPGLHGKYDLSLDGGLSSDELFGRIAGRGWAFAVDHGFHSAANDAFGLFFYLYSAGPPGNRLDGPTTGGGVDLDRNVALRPGQGYTIEYRVKMNTRDPQTGAFLRDGVFTLWVDGVRVLDRRDIHWRGHDAANVWRIVTQFFHGGNGNPSCEMWYDTFGLSFSREYMGPFKKVAP